MPSPQVEQELKTLWKKWQTEEKPNQTPETQAPEKLSLQRLLHELRKDKVLPEDKGRRGYAYANPNQRPKEFLVNMNEDLLEQARAEGLRRNLSLSSYFRECVMYRFYKAAPEQEAQIDQLLADCTSEGRFVAEGERGFIRQVAEKGLTGSAWGFSQIDKVALKLKSSPKPTEEQCLEAMGLDKMQTQYFQTQITYVKSEPSEQNQEETWFVPFSLCNECHKPLTKEQDKLPKCPYSKCNGTKSTEFLVDEKSPAQPKPYAMCAKCHRALPKEAKTWKQCKYCGTTEPEIVVNYEGIQRQPPTATLTIPQEIVESAEEPKDKPLTKEGQNKILETLRGL